MSNTNRMLAELWFDEVWNKGRLDAIDEMMHPDCKVYGLPPGLEELSGPEALKQIHDQFTGALGDLRVTVEDSVVEGDKVAIRFAVEAVHIGDHFGSLASNKPVKYMGMGFARYENGKIVETWNLIDMHGLMQQIG